jgi:hypothetical protein
MPKELGTGNRLNLLTSQINHAVVNTPLISKLRKEFIQNRLRDIEDLYIEAFVAQPKPHWWERWFK